jgi:hypothetical protein
LQQLTILGSSDQTVRIWDIVKGEEVWTYHCEGGILGLEVTEYNDILVGDSAGQLYLLALNNISLTP